MRNLLLIFILCYGNVFAQIAVPIGSGSYASYPPPSENINNFDTREINVSVDNTKPIPTNDWWTNVLVNNFAGNLHAYPVTINPESYGYELIFPTTWSGGIMDNDSGLKIKGSSFNGVKNIAKNWSDWTVTVNLQDGIKSMDVTLGNGFPMAWFETIGFVPLIEFGIGVTYFKEDGTPISFPYTSNSFGAYYGGKYYGIYAPDDTVFRLSDPTTIRIESQIANPYFTVATLKDKTDLSYFDTFAYSIPRDTKISWDYSPEKAKIDVTYNIITDNLKGGDENRVMQGFLPHHYKNSSKDFDFNAKEYATPRGLMKCAEGNIFKFSYDFNGVLAHGPTPITEEIPNPYDPVKMKTMVDAFSLNTDYGIDTYWGGKDILNYAKYTLIAKETGNANYENIKLKSRNILIDWLTYTPGETSRFYARYEKWKGLVGFDTSFGSETFTDSHFHCGYLVYSAAMLGMVDKDFLANYGPMAKLVAKQYANWDRTDSNYPFLRTFSPWRGHSYADGRSQNEGNNQESSSEAMQSWAGIFLLGDVLGDTAMRDAGAFGYLTESRATREYWFDVDNENFPPSYPHSIAGIVFDNRIFYGTWFGNQPLFIHGIQWLPYSPVLDYMAQYPDYLKADYTIMKNEQAIIFPDQTDESDYGADWANYALSYQQIYDPAYVAKRFDEYWVAGIGSKKYNVCIFDTGGQTYYYTHSHRTMGDIQLNFHTSAPNSKVYFNTTTNKYTYVGFNSNPTETIVNVYKDGIIQGTITVPSFSFFNTHTLGTLGVHDSNFEENSIIIYPNPTNSNLNFKTNRDLSNVKITVYTIAGVVLFTQKENIINAGISHVISLKNISKGIYFIKIDSNEGKIVKKIIKE